MARDLLESAIGVVAYLWLVSFLIHLKFFLKIILDKLPSLGVLLWIRPAKPLLHVDPLVDTPDLGAGVANRPDGDFPR